MRNLEREIGSVCRKAVTLRETEKKKNQGHFEKDRTRIAGQTQIQAGEEVRDALLSRVWPPVWHGPLWAVRSSSLKPPACQVKTNLSSPALWGCDEGVGHRGSLLSEIAYQGIQYRPDALKAGIFTFMCRLAPSPRMVLRQASPLLLRWHHCLWVNRWIPMLP